MADGRVRGEDVKVKIYCEGQTERGLKELLTPIREELRVKGLGITIGSYTGNAQLLKKIGSATKKAIEDGSPAVFCAIDLHNVHKAFSGGLREALGQMNWEAMEVTRRVEWLRTHIRNHCVEREYKNKLHPHVLVHEIEALMFADPGRIASKLKVRSIGSFHNPEEINDQNPPKKVLRNLYRQHVKRRYYEQRDGVPLLQSVDFDLVYNKCPNFKALVDDLRSIEP